MSNNLEAIKKVIGEEGLERVQEVLSILGVTLPENADIYRKANRFDRRALSYRVEANELDPEDTCAIAFSGDHDTLSEINQDGLDKIGFFEFNKNHQAIEFIRNGYFYSWTRYNPTYEKMTIYKDKRGNYSNQLSATLIGRNEGINSSTLSIGGKHDFPTMFSYIDYAEMKEHIYDGWGTDEDFIIREPIENYNEAFRRLLTEERFQCLVSDDLKKPEIYALLMAVMKGPIDRVIYDMTLTDQSWRFQKEKEQAEATYNSELDKAADEYKNATAEAARKKKWAGHAATDKRDKKLDEIAELERKYKAQRALRPTE